MDGGIHAVKGFIYQATVILDVLLAHLESRPVARARPEGGDDLELSWTEGNVPKLEFVQIKKPRESDQRQLNLEPWTLREIVQELLPAALAHLDGNDRADSAVRAAANWQWGRSPYGMVLRAFCSHTRA